MQSEVRRNKAGYDTRLGVHEVIDCFVTIQSALLSSFVTQSQVQIKEKFLICG